MCVTNVRVPGAGIRNSVRTVYLTVTLQYKQKGGQFPAVYQKDRALAARQTSTSPAPSTTVCFAFPLPPPPPCRPSPPLDPTHSTDIELIRALSSFLHPRCCSSLTHTSSSLTLKTSQVPESVVRVMARVYFFNFLYSFFRLSKSLKMVPYQDVI